MILADRLSNWIESYNRNGYLSGSILIASNKNILINNGFGMANWEHKVPNTPKTKFRIASITKAFTAMGIFQLYDKQKLNINDYVGKYLPDFPNGDRITVYHCLTNTSGIPNYTSFPDFWSHTMRLPLTLNQLIDKFKERDLDFEPGSRFGYSNSGYALLTAIIEKVSGMSYADYIWEKICIPLGMFNTGCDDGIKVVPDLASGYSFWETPIHPAYSDLSFPLGAYGLYSTTEDLFIWDNALMSSQLLSRDLTEKIFTPYHGSYACGWMVSEILKRTCVNHFGDISGFYCDFLKFVDDQVTVILLSNMSAIPVTHLSREIAKAIFDGDASLPLPAEPIELTKKASNVGKYLIENDTNTVLDVSLKNNELYLTVPKKYGVLYKFKLIPVNHDSNKTIFITEMINEQLVFHYSSSGEIIRIEYTDYFGKYHMVYKVSASLN